MLASTARQAADASVLLFLKDALGAHLPVPALLASKDVLRVHGHRTAAEASCRSTQDGKPSGGRHMFPVLFALLSAVGAWMAWRRNPLYSKRSTLRSAAFVLLAIGAVTGI